jgi:methylthioribose-1-phosphate isomerase
VLTSISAHRGFNCKATGVEQALAIQWIGELDGHLRLIDQTRLPSELVYIECRDVESVWESIRQLRVRGAPAIGIAAAYGICIGLQNALPCETEFFDRLEQVSTYLSGCRPTAVNLFWAIDRMRARAQGLKGTAPIEQIRQALLHEARAIHSEDRNTCRAIGMHGASLLRGCGHVLTHCNAGGLATAEYGTALAVIFTLHDEGDPIHVFVDETRPLLQGARLTAWELLQRNVPTTLICDSTAAQIMKQGRVDAVITGADRIAANGDSANKIGTYGLAVLAHAHGLPFYIAAPTTSFDLTISTGKQIPIEERSADEITDGFGRRTAPPGVVVYNPAFDVTPARLITAIITERGVIQPVNAGTISRALSNAPKNQV